MDISTPLSSKRAALLARLAAERGYLLQRLEGLDEATLTHDPVFDGWTVAALLAHLAYWDALDADRLGKLADGRPGDIEPIGAGEDTVDARNAALQRRFAGLPFEQGLALCQKENRSLMLALERLPDGLLFGRGACDMKGGLAVMLHLAATLPLDQLPVELGLIFYDREEGPFTRIATAIGKYWVCKRAPAFAHEAMECLGGPGYVEETGLPRLYREAPVNSIWEGSGNVNALDLLRAMARSPESLDAYLQALAPAAGCDPAFDEQLSDVLNALAAGATEGRARWLAERMVLLLQTALLVQHAPAFVSDAFITARLRQNEGTYGVVDLAAQDVEAILERARPA